MLDNSIKATEQHERFVARVVESGDVWGLMTADEGWASAPSNDDEREPGGEERTVLPFWSDRSGAARCAQDEWAEYEPTAIELAVFLTEWLPGLAGDGFLVGTNWDGHLIGAEVEPEDLQAELRARLARST